MLLLAALAHADLPAQARPLANAHLAVGLDADGSLVNGDVGLGLLLDADGPEGPIPVQGDWLTPGYPLGLWSLAYGDDVVRVNSGDYQGSADVFSWEAGESATMAWRIGTTTGDDYDAELLVAAPDGLPYLLWSVTLTAHVDLDRLRVALILDPDPDYATNGGYSTDMVLEADAPWVAAGSMVDDRWLAIAAADAIAGLCSFCTDPDTIVASTYGGGEADLAMGVVSVLGDVPAGGSVSVVVAFATATGADEAAALAEGAAESEDWDGDGVAIGADCDDLDAARGPDAAEVADGVDNDCDGEVDEHTTATDDDGDGWTEHDGDCDDADATVYPGAVPGGAADADCDGVADEGWSAEVPDAVDQAEVTIDTGGCAAVPTGARSAPLFLSLLLLLRRRGRA